MASFDIEEELAREHIKKMKVDTAASACKAAMFVLLGIASLIAAINL